MSPLKTKAAHNAGSDHAGAAFSSGRGVVPGALFAGEIPSFRRRFSISSGFFSTFNCALSQCLELGKRFVLSPQIGIELLHQDGGRRVVDLPEAGQHRTGPRVMERALQSQDALACNNRSQAGLAGR